MISLIYTKNSRLLSQLTVTTTFLMGYVDAFTYIEHSGVLASAQTGSLVIFSIKLFSGQWALAASHSFVFIGYSIGILLGQRMIAKKIMILGMLLLQTSLFLFITLLQEYLSSSSVVLLFGFIAGGNSILFTKVGQTTVNNGVMTGNLKKWITLLFDKSATKDVLNLSMIFMIFFLGIGVGTLVINWNPTYCLWLACIYSGLLLIYSTYQQHKINLKQK